jgi:2-polyprenyl-3-methyl-5-hydroxy-6-metoxy-1,4-benzoquinol methylase
MIDRGRFDGLYQTAVGEVMERMPDDWSAFAKHNAGWRKGHFDAEAYLRASVERYWRVYRILAAEGARSVLDVGGFLAAFPLTLRRLGLEVAIAERYDYYGTAIDAIAGHVRANGVTVIDLDFTDPASDVGGARERYDAVTCMAVAEHLAHSPRTLMENLRASLRPGGALAFEVPNLAFWPKRYAFLVRGETVHAPIAEVYHSAVPYTGHHREYTFADARYVVHEAGFEIVAESGFNYGFDTRRLRDRLKYAPALLAKTWAEVILLHCRKPAAER